MSIRLQVLLHEDEMAALKAAAERHRTTVSEYVRRTLREARLAEPSRDVARKLAVVREAAAYAYPTADVESMEEEIARGYRDES
ncbi:MAG: antitoxin [Gemmatimonadetes bacterium]|nr:antitoxin [Gemmatimonadota bacterium]